MKKGNNPAAEIAALLALRNKPAPKRLISNNEKGNSQGIAGISHSPAHRQFQNQKEDVPESVPTTSKHGGNDAYTSTLQLLLEALAEQAKLRALLEHANNPQSTLDEIAKSSAANDLAIKYRTLTLEVEHITMQVWCRI